MTTKPHSHTDQYEEKYKRALADYQNLQKRFEVDRINIIRFANEVLIEKLLPVVDDLIRAQTHLHDQGLNQIIVGIEKMLSEEGIVIFEPTNSDFDPSSMECLETVDGPKNKVIETISRGYRYYNGKLIRPAGVKVGRGKIAGATN